MKPELKEYQVEGLEFLLSGGSGLFFEQGLGKTLTALEWLNHTGGFPVLVVCPKSVCGVWPREAEQFDYPFQIITGTGDKTKRHAARAKIMESIKNGVPMGLAVNYEALRTDYDLLKIIGFKTVIFDESHRLKNRQAQTFKAAEHVVAGVPFRLILSGTPMPKSAEDLWAQAFLVSPKTFPHFWGFKQTFVRYRQIKVNGRTIDIPMGTKSEGLLNEKIKGFALRKTKAECLDLPEKIYKKIFLEMPKEARKHYDTLVNDLIIQIETNGEVKRFDSKASALQKLHQVCQGFIYVNESEAKRLGDAIKLEALLDIIEDTGSESLIVFTYFKADEDLLASELAKLKDVELFHLHADLTADERTLLIDRFQTSPTKGVFLVNLERGKEGITLTRANHVVYYDNVWSHGTRAQSEDRAHRIGQRKNVIYYDLIIENSIDQQIQKVLKGKKETADMILGDTERLVKILLNKADKVDDI